MYQGRLPGGTNSLVFKSGFKSEPGSRGQSLAGGTGILSRTLTMGELGKGRADGKYLLHLMPSVPEAETEDGGGEGHLPKDLPQESRVL